MLFVKLEEISLVKLIGKGTDLNNPITISECDNGVGVDCEHRELKRRFGNYRLLKQI
jgi:hypothetical protein